MSNNNTIISKKFTMQELLLLQKAQVFHNIFVIDKAEFVDYFPDLADPFANNFQMAIDEANDLERDWMEVANYSDNTFELNNLMQEARENLSRLFKYVKIAFPLKADWESFGWGDFRKATGNKLKMVQLLGVAFARANVAEVWAVLSAAGYKLEWRTRIGELQGEIEDLLAIRNEKMEARKRATQHRIEKYNAVWAMMQSINKASKVVFESRPAKISQYLLHKGTRRGKKKAEESQKIQ